MHRPVCYAAAILIALGVGDVSPTLPGFAVGAVLVAALWRLLESIN